MTLPRSPHRKSPALTATPYVSLPKTLPLAHVSIMRLTFVGCVQFFTHSGSRYQLGRPAPWYLEELVQRNYWNEEDPLNPLMVRTDFVLKTSGAFFAHVVQAF